MIVVAPGIEYLQLLSHSSQPSSLKPFQRFLWALIPYLSWDRSYRAYKEKPRPQILVPTLYLAPLGSNVRLEWSVYIKQRYVEVEDPSKRANNA